MGQPAAAIDPPPTAASTRTVDRDAVRQYYAARVSQVGVHRTATEAGLSRSAVTSIIAGSARAGTYALGAMGMATTSPPAGA